MFIICNSLRLFPIFLALLCTACSGNAKFSAADMRAGLRTVSWIDENRGIDRDREIAVPLKSLQQRLIDASNLMYRGAGYRSESIYNPESIPWEIYAVKDRKPNAFSAAPGFVFVTYGIISESGNEAELAAVIAHEMAHILLGHTYKALQKARESGQPNRFAYSEDQEMSADRLGTKILVSAGYGSDSALSAMMATRRDLVADSVARREAQLYLSTKGEPCPYFTEMESREFVRLRSYVNSQPIRQ